MFNNTGCFSRGPGLGSQHQHSRQLTPPVSPIPGPTPSSGFCGNFMSTVYRHTCRQSPQTHKITKCHHPSSLQHNAFSPFVFQSVTFEILSQKTNKEFSYCIYCVCRRVWVTAKVWGSEDNVQEGAGSLLCGFWEANLAYQVAAVPLPAELEYLP